MERNNIKLHTQKVEKMKEATIHIVPHMHYDAVWILNKEDYYFVNIEYILKQAINLISLDQVTYICKNMRIILFYFF